MPVVLGSLTGVDKTTTNALRQLAEAVNKLEIQVGQVAQKIGVPGGVDAAARTASQLEQQQIQQLRQDVTALQQAVAALTAPPTP